MKFLDISTTQNVAISLELATLWDRIFGYFIDLLAILFGMMFMNMFLSLFPQGEIIQYIQWGINLLIIFFYTLFLEILTKGQTLGKMAMGTRRVDMGGKPPSMSSYVIAWSMRMLDIYLTVGSLAVITVSSSSKAQRLGDMLAGTTVIKTRPSLTFQLRDILTIRSSENYTPTYTAVRMFSEDDMLLVKEILFRDRNFPNEANRLLVHQMAVTMASHMGLEQVPNDRRKFLQHLINDYVALTR